MNTHMMRALMRREIAALLIPLVFIVLCFITMEFGFSRVISDPEPFPWIIWLLFGLVFGSGLIARERRLRTDLLLGTLPAAAWKTHSFRFIFRTLFLPILVMALMLAKLPMDKLLYSRVLPYHEFQYTQSIMAALAGFAIGAAVSAVVRRESLALGGGFLGIIAAFVTMATVFLLHPEQNLVFSSALDSIPALEGILVLACFAAVIMAIRARDPGSRREFGRMTIPIVTCFLVGTIVMWAWPYYLLRTPLERLGSISWITPVPGSNTVMVNGNARFGGRIGLYRVTETDSNRISSRIYRFQPSQTGIYAAVLQPPRYVWKRGNRMQMIQMDGTETTLPYSGGLSFQSGSWSPDDRYFATTQRGNQWYEDHKGRQRSSKEVVFLSPDPAVQPVVWVPNTTDGQVPGALVPVGWLDMDNLICFYMPRWKHGTCGPVEIWQVSAGTGSGEKIWAGDLCLPPNYEWQLNAALVILNTDRNSVVLLNRESAELNARGWLTEIFLDGREPLVHRELTGTVEICPDGIGSLLAWKINEKLPDDTLYSDLVTFDLNTGDSRTFRLPRITTPLISPDGNYAATRVYDITHPDFDRIILINLKKGEKTTVLEAVGEMTWTDLNNLAVLSHKGTELGYLNPVSGEYTQRLKLHNPGIEKELQS